MTPSVLRARHDKNKAIFDTVVGPYEWTPLAYVARSCFHEENSTFAGRLAETARLMLNSGVDPYSTYACPFPGAGKGEHSNVLHVSPGPFF